MSQYEVETLILLLTGLPMGLAAVFVVLTYYRIGYGRIGIFKTAGYAVLTMAVLSNVVNHLIWHNSWLDLFLRGWGLVGWVILAVAAIAMWVEADRSIP